MPHLSTPRRKPTAAIALAIMLLACAGLTACGSSSSSTSSTAANAAATSTPAAASTTSGASTTGAPAAGSPAGASGSGSGSRPGASRFAAVRECLQKNGVTLPAQPAGGGAPQRGGPGGLLGGAGARGGFKLPKGMTSTQYQEVLKKCGGGGFRPGNFRGAGAGGARRALNSSRFRQALTSFAACLRQNGIDIPAPNTNGKGPIFSTKGIDTASPKFKAAEAKCRPALVAGLRSGARSGTSAGAAGGATTTTG